jgi:hypothetical protein
MHRDRGGWFPAFRSCLALLCAACCAQAAWPGAPSTTPGMSWDSIKALPDFSGSWIGLPRAPDWPPLRPELLAAAQQASAQYMKSIDQGVDPAEAGLINVYCRPLRFRGSNQNDVHDHFEFLFTPGRVTITNELGLIRRIRLDVAQLPDELEASNAGTSVGHWEGQTLVVETAGLKPDTNFMMSGNHPIKALEMGRNARIVERIALQPSGQLQIAVRITAPEVLTMPWETVVEYRRDPTHVFHEISTCVDDDRSFDNKTGHERFDLTPPAGLPPPPSR